MPNPSNPQAPAAKPDFTRIARDVLQLLVSKGIPPIPANYENLYIKFARKSGLPDAILDRLRSAVPAPTRAPEERAQQVDLGEDQAAAQVMPAVLKVASLDVGLARSVRDLFLRIRILTAQDRLDERAYEVIAALQSVARRSLSGRMEFNPDELLRVFTPPPDPTGATDNEVEGPVHSRVLGLVLRVCITQGKAPDMRALFQRVLKLVEVERLAQRSKEVEGALKALGGDVSDENLEGVRPGAAPGGVPKETFIEVCTTLIRMMRPAVEHSKHAAKAFDRAAEQFEKDGADLDKAGRAATDLAKQFGRHFQSIPDQRRQMKELIGVLMQSLRSVSNGSDAFSDRLGAFEGKLVAVDAPEEIESLRTMLVEETQALSKDVRSMREDFESANERVKRAHKQIAQLQTELVQARDVALMDPLTAIPNRRGFDDWVERTLKTEDGTLVPFAFMVFDVDHFKRVNDTWGHITGDQVLVEIARRIADTVRDHDFLSRFGGEEFCVALPGGNIKEAIIVAGRVLQNIRATPVDTEVEPVPVTTSVGVSEHRPGEPLTDTFDRADQALYMAKESGRDRCCTERDVAAQEMAEAANA